MESVDTQERQGMTRILFGVSGLAFLALVGLFVMGMTSTQPVLLMTSLFCAGPVMTFTLGAAIGRSSNEFSLVRKSASKSVSYPPQQRVIKGELLS